ncbi:TetR family transcriptional regulator [Hypericibacter adhaerens]|uniref:TetR family transcriptional regulator n=1 Tax=Hypericibacter adhaerens TaxID=2602016 RepID=A0A5J6N5G0_9PROT|nr:TetR family transcriptional regulator [Hypericibacter adhaerens]QEX24637.1 TetR family transcriptional regulator [Hypericibacter adhaerens]
MRKSKEEAAKTRRRIVKAAATEFRRHGISETGLSELMAAAGLTHGGFYRHFDSKEQLVAEACAAAVEPEVDSFLAVCSQKCEQKALEALAANYLSTKHRDDPSGGCPFAALGSELARSDEHTRATATASFTKLVDMVAARLDKTKPEVAKQRALVALSLMIGALTLSRIVNDPKLSADILRQAKKQIATV